MRIYSSYKWLKPTDKNCIVCDCETIADSSVRQDSWAVPMMLYKHPSPTFKILQRKLKGFRWTLLENTFFYFGGKEFVLDFYAPTLGIAFSVTRNGRERDDSVWNETHGLPNKDRDALFPPLGIRVIRFSAEQIRSDGFIKEIFEPRVWEVLSELNEPDLPF